MAEFLSEAWLAELDDAARAAPALAGAEPVVVEAHVTSAPLGDVTFRLEVTAHGARILIGPAPTPTLIFVTDRDTATALHRGETNAQRALASGRLKVHGNLATFGRHSDALSALGDVFARVRAQTSSR